MTEAGQKIYAFVGESPFFSWDDLEILLGQSDWQGGQLSQLIHHMLYFSVLGIERENEITYIYDVGYDMNVLTAAIQKFSGTIRYHLHPAFWPALKIKIPPSYAQSVDL